MDNDTIDYTQIEINFQERVQMRTKARTAKTEQFITYIGGKGRENKASFWGRNRLEQKTDRNSQYPTGTTPRENYWFGTTHFWKKEPIDGDDALFDAVDPAGGLVPVWSSEASREIDRLHLNAAIGTAYKGRYGQSTAQPLPAGQIIPHGNVGLTPDKVKLAVSMIRRACPDEEDPIVTMCTGFQITNDLMGFDQVVSSDYNGGGPLKDLRLPYHFGTYFKTIEDAADYNPDDPTTNVVQWDPIVPVEVDGIGAGTHIRYVVMWVKSAMRGKKDRPISTKIHDESKDMGPGAKSITCDLMEGSTRVNPIGVVVIQCADTQPMFTAA